MLFGLFINNAPSFSQAFFNLMPTFISYKAQLYFDLNTEGDLKELQQLQWDLEVLFIILYCFHVFQNS